MLWFKPFTVLLIFKCNRSHQLKYKSTHTHQHTHYTHTHQHTHTHASTHWLTHQHTYYKHTTSTTLTHHKHNHTLHTNQTQLIKLLKVCDLSSTHIKFYSLLSNVRVLLQTNQWEQSGRGLFAFVREFVRTPTCSSYARTYTVRNTCIINTLIYNNTKRRERERGRGREG